MQDTYFLLLSRPSNTLQPHQTASELYSWLQGDLIPWTVGQQMQDTDFPALSGARIVRIAVHPDLPRAGYGSRAVELLHRCASSASLGGRRL